MRKKNLVRLWKRASRDGKSFTYYFRYKDLEGKFHMPSLGHSDVRKAEKQRIKKEKELQMGYCSSGSMRLSEFRDDCLKRTGDQIRESTKQEYSQGMSHFIKVVGDIDIQAVTLRHGEQFRQACLDEGNSPSTVAKKIRELKLMLELAIKRKQFNYFDENPLKHLKPPKTSKNIKINTYTEEQCNRLVKASSEYQKEWILEWDLVITLALTTGMRKSEILNLVWSDIDFDNMTIEITPKENTEYTWAWEIKDTDSRTLPLTEDVLKLLINLQERRPASYPYVFVSPKRYDRIQLTRKGLSKRKKNTWTVVDANNSVVNGFTGMFNDIREKAGIRKGTFHDLRRTAITNWFYSGLEIIEVMRIAGHSKYDTTLKYYLAVKDNLVDKARGATKHRVSQEMLERRL